MARNMNRLKSPQERPNSCVICGGESGRIRQLQATDIKDSHTALFGDSGIGSIQIENYELFRCSRCELEFAVPLLPGSNDYYEWLVKHSGYYPSDRWEWKKSLEYIENESKQEPSKQLLILDVGCGGGSFLERLRSISNVRGVGIDLTDSSVQLCREKGLEAYCCDLSEMSHVLNKKVDVVTLFHVLEHVSNPVGLLTEVRKLLNPGGCILISTPFSPMSFELNWLDPLNHPPHHLTRWNEKAYRSLAKRMNMSIAFYYPKAHGVLRRTLWSLYIRAASPFKYFSRFTRVIRLCAYLLQHPVEFVKEMIGQRRRRVLFNEVAPDLILIQLTLDNEQ